MNTLTYGMKIPENGDLSNDWMPAIADNFTQQDGHTHDGVNSPLLSSSAFTVITVAASAAGWVSQGNGTYKQTVTMPGTLAYDNKNIAFRDASSGDILYLTCKKVTATTFDIYINDNSISVTVLIGA